VNGVYAFGFLFMLPQLFVNYKLKSVAHLPWRAFMYKVSPQLDHPVDCEWHLHLHLSLHVIVASSRCRQGGKCRFRMCGELVLVCSSELCPHPRRSLPAQFQAFNTFIDDLFAFIIKMPTLHRMSCFRDDIVFAIFMYIT